MTAKFKLSQRLLRQIQRFESSTLTSSSQNVRPFQEIPSPKGWPILGNLPLLLRKENLANQMEFHARLRRELGDIYRLKIPGKGRDFIFVYDLSDAKTLLRGDGLMPSLPFFENICSIRTGPLKEKFATPGLVAKDEVWYDFRRCVQQDLMRPKSALYYVSDLDSIMDSVLERMEGMMDSEGRILSGLSQLLKEFALESVSVMFLGSRLGVLQGSPLSQQLMSSVTGVTGQIMLILSLPVPLTRLLGLYQRVTNHTENVYNLVEQEVRKSTARLATDSLLAGSVVGKMVARNGRDSPVPVVMAVDALSAGIDSTGYSSAYLLYHLAKNPDKQEKLFKEIYRFAGRNGKLSADYILQMKYLKACQTESMRINPIAMGTARRTRVDLVLKGFMIPAGTQVMRHGYLNSNDETNFKQADRFIPERWIRGTPEYVKVDPFANLPFGHGPRSCVGQRFAKLELYIFAAKIVQRYKLEYIGEPLKINSTSGFIAPDMDLGVRFTPRN